MVLNCWEGELGGTRELFFYSGRCKEDVMEGKKQGGGGRGREISEMKGKEGEQARGSGSPTPCSSASAPGGRASREGRSQEGGASGTVALEGDTDLAAPGELGHSGALSFPGGQQRGPSTRPLRGGRHPLSICVVGEGPGC